MTFGWKGKDKRGDIHFTHTATVCSPMGQVVTGPVEREQVATADRLLALFLSGRFK